MGKELVTTTKGRNDIAAVIQKRKGDFAMALGKTVDSERFVRIAMSAIRSSPALQKCDPGSVLSAVMLCAQLQLEPGPLGHAYLVPFGGECVFIPGYQGLIELAYRSGRVASIYAELVHEGDKFEYHLGTDRRIEHQPPKFGQPRGPVVGVYAVAKLKNGADPQFIVLTTDDVERHRNFSRGKNSPAWRDHWDAMAKKTAVRQLAKWIPKSTEMAQAIGLEQQFEQGQRQDAGLAEDAFDGFAGQADEEIIEAEPVGDAS